MRKLTTKAFDEQLSPYKACEFGMQLHILSLKFTPQDHFSEMYIKKARLRGTFRLQMYCVDQTHTCTEINSSRTDASTVSVQITQLGIRMPVMKMFNIIRWFTW